MVKGALYDEEGNEYLENCKSAMIDDKGCNEVAKAVDNYVQQACQRVCSSKRGSKIRKSNSKATLRSASTKTM